MGRSRSIHGALSTVVCVLFSLTVSAAAPSSGPPPVDLRVKPAAGPELERWFFADWHQPYGLLLPREELERIQYEMAAVAEPPMKAVNSWQLVGPAGMANAGDGYYSGRILDLDLKNSSTLRIAAASGGFWTHEQIVIFPVPVRLTDDLPTQVIGSFSTDPSDESVIIIGTGEPGIRNGTGMYLTDNGGASWYSIAMTPEPEAFYRIRHDLNDEHLVYAATTSGFYRSTDRGVHWTRTLTGVVTDFAINPWNTSTLHAVVAGDGYYRSENYGVTWAKITSGLPTVRLGRGAIAVAPSLPSRIYIAWVRSAVDEPSDLLGVYRSNNAGTTWSAISPSNYMGGQGWYNNVLTVDPANEDIVFAGGVQLMRTTNGGASWAEVWDADLHADYHALAWSSNGTHLYAGHDGGLSISSDRGTTWSSVSNALPITQFYHIDTYPTSDYIFGGGTQDNLAPVTTNGGSSWVNSGVGDAGGFVVNPNNAAEMWTTVGLCEGDWLFKRLHSTNSGVGWSDVSSGLPASGQWFPQLRHDRSSPGMLFTNVDSAVYASSTGGSSWSLYFGGSFTATVRDLTTSKWLMIGRRAVYACLDSTTPGNRLWVNDADTWHERSTGLPAGGLVRRVVPDPGNSYVAYALMNGLGNPGFKVFRSTNRGSSWSNISGDLPDVPVSDLVVHPTDNSILFVSSEFGCFRSTTGGAHWETWNNGMPTGAIVTDLATIDLRSVFGGYWVVAGTYGHSIWKREISGADAAVFSDGFETGNTGRWSATIP